MIQIFDAQMIANPYVKSIHYQNRWLRIFFALAASLFILFHGRWYAFFTLIQLRAFYIALIVSFIIAFLLVYAVHRITCWLDTRYDWRERLFERILLQSCLGIVGPALIDLIAVLFFLKAKGMDPINYLLVDYPVIVCFLVFLNVYYLIHYLALTNGFKVEEDSEKKTELP